MTHTIPARPPQARKPNFSEFEVEVDQRLWAKHTERSNKPTNPVAGPNTCITTGPSASKDAWSARFSPSVSAPDLEDVKGTRFVECRWRRKDRHHDPPSVTASVGCSGVTVGSCHRRWVAVAILAPPSALDKPGALYIFEIPAALAVTKGGSRWRSLRLRRHSTNRHAPCPRTGADTDGENRALQDPPSVTASVGCSGVTVGSCHRRWVMVAILAPPSALDKPGALYIFEIPADQPNRRTRHALAWAQIRMAKIGHSKHPWKRWAQWLCKCWGQQQDWWAYWNVLYAAKFEALIHLHFKLRGAWMLPSECHFCGVRHTEKFGFRACGGRAGIACVIVFYLRRLGWPVDEVAM
ncbi:hypothetical protein B0H10DRAFT_2225600 [Mycena sp. CBHHK59/15]|nr:hypothetical protein B0H10DRAFT_2225600 [Mycena sp. CBHHK59/15]